jgi:hypothetical protein
MKPLPATPELLAVAERVVWFKAPSEALAHLRQFAAEDLCNSLILLARAVSDAKM